MSEPQGPNTDQEVSSDIAASPTSGPPASAPTGRASPGGAIPQMPSGALPPPPTFPTRSRPSPTTLLGGGAGAAGGALTSAGFFLPWVTLLAVVSIGGCGRGLLQVAMVTLTAWYIAGGAAGLFPALATWLMLVMVLLIINFGLRALVDRRRTVVLQKS